jgi:hypothetical protein
MAQPHPPTEPNTSLTVNVTDREGAVIGRALVMVLSERDLKSSPLERQTNSSGQASVVLADGFYYVFVAAPGFSAHCETLRVRDGKDSVLKVILDVDELMLRERADYFTESPPVPLKPR